ncbi:hypothetical protein DICPUDRAFT_159169 [Dictyostelium purpureum]|uniref:Uncharacterized protein n=1 Tax=Dictyostelium purpureum TaxID=5786 RepID=F1A3G3_DICPU|nr:uncharacterized protein DICPUDRAFT_159169 [Dictyostelium purpureum]EGC29271.1 hypothetical protein DICPUDRAFT_159169 [Dictyostelium purpureum]|eukprot:XP_003294208.1 hypothetical protein DICPUDRAFT_159169 [Dictyostelium purpureum]
MIEQTPVYKNYSSKPMPQLQYPTFPTAAATTINQFYFNRIKFKHIRSLGFMVKRKLWNLLEIKLKADEYILIKSRDIKLFLETNRDVNLISLLYEKKKEQLHMFDLVECAYSLDNIEALEYFLSMNVPTFLPNYTINKKSFSISSIKSLELLLKYRVNIIEPYSININNNNNNNNTTAASSSSSSSLSFSLNNSNSNSYNYTTTVSLVSNIKNSFSNRNNNTTIAAPEPTIFSLKNSNSNYNLNSSVSEYSNLNNNSICLARSASCSSISSCNSNDSNDSSGSSGCNNKNSNSFLINNGNITLPPPSSYRNLIKEKLKSPPNYLLPHLKTLNMGNIQEALDKFNSNRADYPKITYEVIKKCLKYSNIEDLEKLFRAISTNSTGIPFDRFSQSVLCGRKDVYSLIVKIFPEFFNPLSYSQSIRQTIIRGDLEMLSFLIEKYREVMDYNTKDIKSELIELSIKNNHPQILKYILNNIK